MIKKLSVCLFFFALTISYGYSETLSLERCLELSRAENLEVQKSLSDFEMQKIKTKKAEAGYYPRGSAGIELSAEKHIDGTDNAYHPYYFGILQPLFYFGENRFKTAKEKLKTYSSLFEVLETGLVSEQNAGSKYMQAIMTKRKQSHVKNLSRFLQKRYNLAMKMVEDGRKTKESINRLSVYLAELDSDYISFQYDYDSSIASLGKIINKDKKDIDGLLPFEITDEIDIDRNQIKDLEEKLKEEELKKLLFDYARIFSPLWNKQRYDILASEKDIQISQTALYPKISAIANFEQDSKSDDRLWRLGIVGVWNFLSPEDYQEILLKKEAFNNQKIAVEIFERDRKYDIVSSYEKLVSTIQQLDSTRNRVTQSRAYLIQTADRYVQGNASEVELIDACSSYDDAQRDRFSLVQTYFTSRLELLKNLGQSTIMQTPTVEEYTRHKLEDLNYTKQNLYFDFFFFLDMRKAVLSNNYELAKKYLNDYEKSGQKLYSGWELLHFAVFWNNKEMVTKTLKEGYDVNAPDFLGSTPLSIAVALNQKEIVQLLLEAGANPNIHSGIEEWTPLYRASNKSSLEICEMLINAGALVNAKTRMGRTALHNATQSGNLELMKFLLKKGADINAKTSTGWTVEYIAQLEGHEDIENYLVSLKK